MAATKDRIMGALLGAIIGDALGVGPHWYYDLEKMRTDYGAWIDDYAAPKENRFHAGLAAGQYSQTGQVYAMLMASVAESGRYVEADFTRRLDALLDTLDGTPRSGRYTDQAMRDVWQNRREFGKAWAEAGSHADTAEAAMRAPVPGLRFVDDFRAGFEAMVSNVRLTHRDPFIAGRSVAFGLIVAALARGASLEEASKDVRKRAHDAGLELSVPVPVGSGAEAPRASFMDGVLQPGWSVEAAADERIAIEPAHAVCRLFGLACPLDFLAPAALYLAARFAGDFESAVLHAINGGGNNMARGALTGALAGAMAGLQAIPKRFVDGLENGEELLGQAEAIADAAR